MNLSVLTIFIFLLLLSVVLGLHSLLGISINLFWLGFFVKECFPWEIVGRLQLLIFDTEHALINLLNGYKGTVPLYPFSL